MSEEEIKLECLRLAVCISEEYEDDVVFDFAKDFFDWVTESYYDHDDD